jgi:uncharacterized caspase-like protein
LYQNGKLVGSDDGARGFRLPISFTVRLIPGDNVFKAVGLSRQNVEGIDSVVTVNFSGKGNPKPHLFLLVVGVNEYEDSNLNLHFPQEDANAIAAFFGHHAAPLFASPPVIIRLVDGDATKLNIMRRFEQLQHDAQPEDVVLLYFAGHGLSVGNEFYMLPHETRIESDVDADALKYGISAAAIGTELQKVRALKQILVLDACQSEAALPQIAKTMMFRATGVEERAQQMMARSFGIYLLSASTREQYAVEIPELGHGLLSRRF